MKNREIKLRVWSKKSQKFLHELVEDADLVYTSENQWYVLGGDALDDESYLLQQYTGHKDCKGREIFEGDVVRYHYGNPDASCTDSVAWDNCEWQLLHFDGTESGRVSLNFALYGMGGSGRPTLEVVGNVMQNQELLDRSN